MKLICKIFEHKYRYYKTTLEPKVKIRSCKNCNKLQKQTSIYNLDTGNEEFIWIDMIQMKHVKKFEL